MLKRRRQRLLFSILCPCANASHAPPKKRMAKKNEWWTHQKVYHTHLEKKRSISIRNAEIRPMFSRGCCSEMWVEIYFSLPPSIPRGNGSFQGETFGQLKERRERSYQFWCGKRRGRGGENLSLSLPLLKKREEEEEEAEKENLPTFFPNCLHVKGRSPQRSCTTPPHSITWSRWQKRSFILYQLFSFLTFVCVDFSIREKNFFSLPFF